MLVTQVGNGEEAVLEVSLCSLLCFGYSGMYIADGSTSFDKLRMTNLKVDKPKTVDIFSHY